jgi:hypothetical protein
MIVRCPHCKGACKFPDGSTVQKWACPHCAKPISADLLSSAAAPDRADSKPASSPTSNAAPKGGPDYAANSATGETKKKTSVLRLAGDKPPEAPTPINRALCAPVPRWGRRLTALAFLILSASLLAASAGLAIWKARNKGAQPAAAQAAVESKEAHVSQPEKPPNRPEELYGGIEIGSKGIKSVVVRGRTGVVQGPASELAAPVQTANTTLVSHLAETGILNPDALRDTVRVVGRFHERLRQDQKIPPERIYIIVSSGLFSPIQDKPEQIETNKRHLADAVRKETGQDVVFLNKSQDLELTFRASVPAGEVEESLLVDLSSGKTLVCYSEGSLARFVSLAFPFGAVPLAEEATRRVEERGGKFAARMDELLKDGERLQPWREGLRRNPGLANLKHVYLTGGPIWALATIAHPQERGPHVALSFVDVEALVRQLEESPSDSIPEPKWSGDKDEAVAREVEAAMRSVRKTYNRQQLLAGMKILLMLGGDLGFQVASDKKLRFARDGYLGPALGYAVLLKNKKR